MIRTIFTGTLNQGNIQPQIGKTLKYLKLPILFDCFDHFKNTCCKIKCYISKWNKSVIGVKMSVIYLPGNSFS